MLVLWLFDSPQFRNISGKDSASLNPQTKFTQKAWVPTAAEHKTHSSSASGAGSAQGHTFICLELGGFGVF